MEAINAVTLNTCFDSRMNTFVGAVRESSA